MNLVRSVLPSAYAAKARGVVLCAITVGAAYVYYLAVDADDAIPPAAADSIPAPPVVRAASITQPIHIIPDAATREIAAAPVPSRAKVARDLQTALAKAHCYDGPITGKWTAASKDAMDAFLVAVNAQLPVGDPDPALLALVASNTNASCSSKSPVVVDALNTPSAQATDKREQPRVAIATDTPPSISASEAPSVPADERSMLDHPWAQPEMLVPSNEMTSPAAAAAPIAMTSAEPAEHDAAHAATIAAPTASIDAPPTPPVMKVSTAASSESALHFEGSSVVSDPKPEAAALPAPTSALTKVTQRKTKSAKRRASRSNDSSFGVSFDSIQRSLSSLFD